MFDESKAFDTYLSMFSLVSFPHLLTRKLTPSARSLICPLSCRLFFLSTNCRSSRSLLSNIYTWGQKHGWRS